MGFTAKPVIGHCSPVNNSGVFGPQILKKITFVIGSVVNATKTQKFKFSRKN